MVKVHAAPEGSPWMWTLGKPLKRILERAHQYRVIAEGLQFHLDRENLPKEAADLVRIAQPALAEAAGVVEESEADMRTLASTCPPRADCVAKLFAALRRSNYRIQLNAVLSRCCAAVLVLESILLSLVAKIVLQHNLP
jgi:hypothetical protein